MIPFNAPPVVGTELDYMQSAMGSGKLCGDGGFTRRCQQWLEQRFGSAKGSLIREGDTVRGSALIGQNFTDNGYF
ncbi:potassium-transporting ATPase subunit C, partial [Escherichia coli]|uniref:potassium-transporting ATPase subunit C n=1 Tax=Escherichia coli TaxID=562 RepID=UPI0002A28172